MTPVININDFDKIKGMFKEADTEERWTEINDLYCGPATGIYFDKDANEIVIAKGWKAADNGDIVRE